MKQKLNKALLQKVVDYFNGDALAAEVWLEKYALKDADGNYLEATPNDMHNRLAKAFYKTEAKYKGLKFDFTALSEYGQERTELTEEAIFNLFDGFKFLVPQGSVMANLGDDTKFTSLSNCVVLPELYDSYGGILYADQQLVQLFKRRCGVGLDISNLRPVNERVKNSAGSTSGAVSFMSRFSNTTREVAQHGRRGALMITMDVRHPEIIEFIESKKDLTKVTGANISVKLNNDFMRAVRYDKSFTLRWPIEGEQPKIEKEVSAKVVWDKIVELAHASAEPGVIFWDQQHFYSTSSIYPQYKNTSTNPCSEIAMQGGDSCRLMAINLFSFVDAPFTDRASFNYEKLYEVAYEGMRLMDDLVDLELEAIERIITKVKSDPEPEDIKAVELATWQLLFKNGKAGRRTGLGFTGLADAVAALNKKYDEVAAQLSVDAIMRTKLLGELDSTIDMAIERGTFDGFNPEIEKLSDFSSKMMYLEFPEAWERMQKYGRRNVSFSTVAPTGTLSLLTQTSSGIEPVYMLSYSRRKKVSAPTSKSVADEMGDHWETFEVQHPKLALWQKVNPNKPIKESPYYGCTANEVNWERRILIQKTVQKYTTHSISSTINLPNSASKKLVSEIYFKAWEEGLKGLTIYRDGSRDGVLQAKSSEGGELLHAPVERPSVIDARVLRFKNNTENWVAVVGIVHGVPYEIFTGRMDDFMIPPDVKSGFVKRTITSDGKVYDFVYSVLKAVKGEADSEVVVEGLSRAFDAEYWNYAKLISGVLRIGTPLTEVVKLVRGLNLDNDRISNWKNGVARALQHFIPIGTKANVQCVNCEQQGSLLYQEGCLLCSNCGYTECS